MKAKTKEIPVLTKPIGEETIHQESTAVEVDKMKFQRSEPEKTLLADKCQIPIRTRARPRRRQSGRNDRDSEQTSW